jgi:hypothetical protein
VRKRGKELTPQPESPQLCQGSSRVSLRRQKRKKDDATHLAVTSPKQQREVQFIHILRKLVPVTAAHRSPEGTSRRSEEELAEIFRNLSKADEVGRLEVSSNLRWKSTVRASRRRRTGEAHLSEQIEGKTKHEVGGVGRLRFLLLLSVVRRRPRPEKSALVAPRRATRFLLGRFG